MIPAQKNALLDGLLYRYLQHLLRRSFRQVAVRGLERLQNLPPDKPAIVFSNHTNWWDALMVFELTRCAPRKKFYCMMEEKNLRSYHFFSWLGAFSVDPDDPVRAAASVRYALRLLKKPETLLWIFPQGKMAPPHELFVARPGAAYLARRNPGATLLPVAFRYEFFREEKPLALIEVGPPLSANTIDDADIQKACQFVARSLDEAVRAQSLRGFASLLTPQLSINKKWQKLSFALRGRLSEFDPEN